MATTEPLTGATIYQSSDQALGGQQMGDIVTDLAPYTLPRFVSTSDRDTKYAAWVAAGGTMANGMTCWCDSPGSFYERIGGTWVRRALVSASPSYAGTAFAANDTTPLQVVKDPNGKVNLIGMAKNTAAIPASVAGVWFTIPTGFRPASDQYWTCYVEGTGIIVYWVKTDGTVNGYGMTVGSYPIPLGRFWTFNQTWVAA